MNIREAIQTLNVEVAKKFNDRYHVYFETTYLVSYLNSSKKIIKYAYKAESEFAEMENRCKFEHSNGVYCISDPKHYICLDVIAADGKILKRRIAEFYTLFGVNLHFILKSKEFKRLIKVMKGYFLNDPNQPHKKKLSPNGLYSHRIDIKSWTDRNGISFDENFHTFKKVDLAEREYYKVKFSNGQCLELSEYGLKKAFDKVIVEKLTIIKISKFMKYEQI